MESDQHPISRALHEALQDRLESGGADVEHLRVACASSPEDLEKRARLLGALSFSQQPGPTSELVEEVLWWMRHHPLEIPHVGHVFSMLSHAPYWAYQRVREAWEEVLATHCDVPGIALAAADCFCHHEPDRALALLERAHSAMVDDPSPGRRAGHIWWLRSMRFHRNGESERDRDAAAEALRWFERALEREHSQSSLGDACEAALAAGQPERARVLAEQLLASVACEPADWNTGNAIYHGHSVLGEIALLEGATESAKDHLKLAGQTPGSPQLNSFGPELQLADALLQRGERSAVVDFLREIGRFWQSGRGRIDLWCLEIDRGETPRLSRFGCG